MRATDIQLKDPQNYASELTYPQITYNGNHLQFGTKNRHSSTKGSIPQDRRFYNKHQEELKYTSQQLQGQREGDSQNSRLKNIQCISVFGRRPGFNYAFQNSNEYIVINQSLKHAPFLFNNQDKKKQNLVRKSNSIRSKIYGQNTNQSQQNQTDDQQMIFQNYQDGPEYNQENTINEQLAEYQIISYPIQDHKQNQNDKNIQNDETQNESVTSNQYTKSSLVQNRLFQNTQNNNNSLVKSAAFSINSSQFDLKNIANQNSNDLNNEYSQFQASQQISQIVQSQKKQMKNYNFEGDSKKMDESQIQTKNRPQTQLQHTRNHETLNNRTLQKSEHQSMKNAQLLINRCTSQKQIKSPNFNKHTIYGSNKYQSINNIIVRKSPLKSNNILGQSNMSEIITAKMIIDQNHQESSKNESLSIQKTKKNNLQTSKNQMRNSEFYHIFENYEKKRVFDIKQKNNMIVHNELSRRNQNHLQTKEVPSFRLFNQYQNNEKNLMNNSIGRSSLIETYINTNSSHNKNIFLQSSNPAQTLFMTTLDAEDASLQNQEIQISSAQNTILDQQQATFNDSLQNNQDLQIFGIEDSFGSLRYQQNQVQQNLRNRYRQPLLIQNNPIQSFKNHKKHSIESQAIKNQNQFFIEKKMLQHQKLNKYQSINNFIMNQLQKYRSNKKNLNSSLEANKRIDSSKNNDKQQISKKKFQIY